MTQILHASAVVAHGKGLLILGPSGSGKSALSLQLIALGAKLIADDRTEVSVQNGGLVATCPPAIQGQIEARGVGILRLPYAGRSPIYAAVDLSKTETERLPPLRQTAILGHDLPLFHAVAQPHFPAALMCYLAGERCA